MAAPVLGAGARRGRHFEQPACCNTMCHRRVIMCASSPVKDNSGATLTSVVGNCLVRAISCACLDAGGDCECWPPGAAGASVLIHLRAPLCKSALETSTRSMRDSVRAQ